MHLTNASGQTVSLLNDAENARSAAAAAAAAAATAAKTVGERFSSKQWTATLVAAGKAASSPTQQQFERPVHPSRPSLPSLEQLSVAAALKGRASEKGSSSNEQALSSSSSPSRAIISHCAGATTAAAAAVQSPPRPGLAHYHSVSASASASTNTSSPHHHRPRHHHHPTQHHHHNISNHSHSYNLKPHAHSQTSSTRTLVHPASSIALPSLTSSSSKPNTTDTAAHSPRSGGRPSVTTDLQHPSSSSSLSPSSLSAPHEANAATASLSYHSAQQNHYSQSPASRPRLTHHEAYSRKASYSSQLSAYSTSSTTTTDAERTAGYISSSQSDPADSPVFSPGVASTQSASTPQLLRFDSGSTSSTSTRSAQTPSPMTPSFGFDPLDQNKNGNLNAVTADNLYIRQAAAGAGPTPPAGPYFSSAAAGIQPQQALAPQNQALMTGIPPVNMISPSTGTPVYNFSSGPSPLGFDDPAFPLPPAGLPFPPLPGVTADLIQPSPVVNSLNSSVSPQNPHAAPSLAGANSTANANGSQQKAKKKYPCPHAARFGCTDTFTTSGHAARHGKKHTGEKNILCPTCNKAFTRKDNMKQHERTHRNNNSTSSVNNRRESVSAEASEGGASAASKDGNSSKRSKTSSNSVSSSAIADAAHTPSTAPTTSIPFSPLSGAATVSPLDADLLDGGPSPGADDLSYAGLQEFSGTKTHRPTNERKVSEGGQSMDGEGESPGLDALAMAASGMAS